MRLSPAKRAYLRSYYRQFTDAALGKALGEEPSEIRAAAKRLKLKRTPDDIAAIQRGVDAPVYDGQMPLPSGLHRLSRRDVLVGAIASLIVLGVYISTLPPTVTGEDSGEFVTAAYTLGIPHPPGYASWCLLTHPFTWIPIGTVAWRVALASSVFGAGATLFIYLIVFKLSGRHLAAIAASFLFAFSKDAWEQFIIAEVYALNAFFIASGIFLLLLWYESRRTLPLLVFSFLYGLSLANHSTARLMGPPFLLFVFSVDAWPWRRWKFYFSCLGLSLLGLCAFLYLPVRSLANPPVDWGNPETWDNFWAVVRQDQFAFLLTKQTRSFHLFFAELRMFWDFYREAFTAFFVAAPLLGLYPLWRANRLLFGFIVGLAALLSVGLILVLNYGTDRTALIVNDVFFIPFEMLAAIIAGVGMSWLFQIRVRGVSLRPAALLIGIACLAAPVTLHYRAVDKSRYWFAYDYGRNILNSLEPNSVYLPGADHATFPGLYLQTVEGMRPDVVIGNKYGYIEESLYRDMPEEIRTHFHKIPTNDETRLIEEWIVIHADRPVYFTEKRAFPDGISAKMENAGLAYRVVEKDEAWTARNYWTDYAWHTLEMKDAGDEFTAGLVISDYYFARGRDELAAGDKREATEYFELSVEASKGTPESLNNIGTALAERGDLDGAAHYYLRSLDSDASYVTGLRNLGQVYMSLEKYSEAEPVFDRLRRLDMKDPGPHLSHVGCLRRLGRFNEARKELLDFAKVQPNDAMIYRELGMLYLNDLRDPLRGRKYLMMSLRLDPNQQDLAVMIDDPKYTRLPNFPGAPTLPELPNPNPVQPGPIQQ